MYELDNRGFLNYKDFFIVTCVKNRIQNNNIRDKKPRF